MLTSTDKPLTPKQEAFCLAYMANTGNAAAGYRSSYNAGGMADATICRKACELMSNGKIAARIAELRAEATKVAIISEARVLAEVVRVGLFDPAAPFGADGCLRPIHTLPQEVRAAIASLKFWDKNAALEKLMKHLGSFERNNRQRGGLFDHFPTGEVERIVNLLREHVRQDANGEKAASSRGDIGLK